MHRRVAEVLRDRFADSAAAEPQLLAHHFTQAGLTEAAIEWWGKAGDQALRRSAFQEAISHLGKAIEMADQGTDLLPPSDRLRLQIAYSNALVGLTGNHSSETKVAFSRARELAAASGTPLERFSIYYGLWAGSYARSETTVMQELSTEMLKDVEQLPGLAGILRRASRLRRDPMGPGELPGRARPFGAGGGAQQSRARPRACLSFWH